MRRKYLVYLWLMIFIPLNTASQTVKSSEYVVKATFLYNFAKFVEWPAHAFERPDTPVILCILGKDIFGDALKTIENKVIRGRTLLIRHCQDTNEAKGCHILFISPSGDKNLQEILSDIKDTPCLTVSDTEAFAQRGGIIRFFTMGNKIRFEINPEAAKRSHLKISSRLLKLARIFKEPPEKKGN
ncbi:YfiR family protein [Desulfonema magnum]|uniref:DUF4154 n=1 Tax=Desulfonema magnum TaxID=45655 RepID=A0A975BLB3_9BACT|nr:YfiR family protein [Desulfonema magnum]QTA87601.1 DUF4154 [Desulfonema magnum]